VPGEVYYAEDHGIEYGGEQYQWTYEGVPVSGADEWQYNFSPMTPGLYSCQVTSLSGCFVEVFYQLCAAITVDITQTGNTLDATAGFDTYQWYLDGAELTGEESATISPSAVGNYTVEVADGPCSETSDPYNYNMVGIQETAEHALNVYPNPTSGVVYLEMSDYSGMVNISVMDMSGRVILNETRSASSTQFQINLSHVVSGAYTIEIHGADGFITHSRLIKN